MRVIREVLRRVLTLDMAFAVAIILIVWLVFMRIML